MAEQEMKYTKSHEWIEPAGARRKVGITAFAAEQLGDIVFVESAPEGEEVAAGDEVTVIESTKATSPIYAPLAGKVGASNPALANNPEKVNEDPLGDGYLYELEVADGADESALMGYEEYLRFRSEEADGH